MDTPRPLGYWLKLVDRLIDEQFASTLEDHGVTRRQWQLLNVLRNEPATEERLDAAVAPFLSADGGESSAEHLAELVDSSWVSLSNGTYTITERGASALDKLSEVVSVQRTVVSEGVSPDQYEQTVTVLERMARNLGYTD
jgi:DNA-binding MarR family transcriptional regulator